MLLIFFLYPSVATYFPPLLPGNLHLIKLESVQAKRSKKSTVDLIKIKRRKAVFSHVPWMRICVCHKLGLLRERCWASHMANIRLRHTSRNYLRILELILFSFFRVSSYSASIQETTWLEIQWGFQVQWKIVNDQTFWSQEQYFFYYLEFKFKNDSFTFLLLLLWSRIESRGLKEIVKIY